MKVNRKTKLGSLLLVLLVVSACAAPANNQPRVMETASAQSTSTELSSNTELCSNRYFPVREGATWTYKNSGSPAGEFQFTDRVSSVRADGFTLTSQLGNSAWMQEWACQPEGLVALQLGGAPAMTLTAQGVQLDLAVNNVNGVTFPRDIAVGNQWQHNLDFDGQVEMAGQSAMRRVRL